MPFVRVDSAEDAVAYCEADLLWYKWNSDTDYHRQSKFGELAGFDCPADLVSVWKMERKTISHYGGIGLKPGWEFYVLAED